MSNPIDKARKLRAKAVSTEFEAESESLNAKATEMALNHTRTLGPAFSNAATVSFSDNGTITVRGSWTVVTE